MFLSLLCLVATALKAGTKLPPDLTNPGGRESTEGLFGKGGKNGKKCPLVLEEAPVQGDTSNLVFFVCLLFYFVSTARKLTARGFLQLVCNHVTVALTASPGWKHMTSSSTLTGTETYQLVCPDDMRFMRIWCNSGLQRRPPRPREAPLTRTLFSSTGPAAALHSGGPLSLPSNFSPAPHITHQRWKQTSGKKIKEPSVYVFSEGLTHSEDGLFLLFDTDQRGGAAIVAIRQRQQRETPAASWAAWCRAVCGILIVCFAVDKMCSLMFNRSFIDPKKRSCT